MKAAERPSNVYVLVHSDGQLMKIGKANSIEGRMSQLGAARFNLDASFGLRLKNQADAFVLERTLHAVFSSFRVSRDDAMRAVAHSDGATEWFRADGLPKLISYLANTQELMGFERVEITTELFAPPLPTKVLKGPELAARKAKKREDLRVAVIARNMDNQTAMHNALDELLKVARVTYISVRDACYPTHDMERKSDIGMVSLESSRWEVTIKSLQTLVIYSSYQDPQTGRFYNISSYYFNNGDITLTLNLDIERAGFCEDPELLRLEKWSERFILLARELPPTTTLPGKGLDGSAGKTAS